MKHICPVCGYSYLKELPYDKNNCASHEICPCCGFEFGFDDFDLGIGFDEYRADWINEGMLWFEASKRPKGWSFNKQIENIK